MYHNNVPKFSKTLLPWGDIMVINYNEVIVSSEPEKKILQYISKISNNTVWEGIAVLKEELKIDIDNYVRHIYYLDIELMIFIGALEIISGKKICQIYAKAFRASILKQYDGEIIRERIIKDLCIRLNVSSDFLISVLHQFYYYAQSLEWILNYKKKDDIKNAKEKKHYLGAIFIVIFAVILTINIFPNYRIPTMGMDTKYILEVRGLTLKYMLISTAGEIYDINERIKEEQSLYYKSYGSEVYNHYKWIKNTYSNMSQDMKSHLATLYKSGTNEGKYIYLLAGLEDGADINQIIRTIKSSNIELREKKAAEEFYPYFYEEYLKEYIKINGYKYERYALELNNQLQQEKPDILGFIEETSGITYDKKYKPILYYTMRPGNAWGFTHKDHYISLIPCTESEYVDLFYIPYHEYSHGIFKTITHEEEFKKIADKLKNNTVLYNSWNNGYYNDYYTWEGWCEDNLVEGFAMYLDYKARDKKPNPKISIRPYDKRYFNYLVENRFNPSTTSLRNITIKFLEEIAN